MSISQKISACGGPVYIIFAAFKIAKIHFFAPAACYFLPLEYPYLRIFRACGALKSVFPFKKCVFFRVSGALKRAFPFRKSTIFSRLRRGKRGFLVIELAVDLSIYPLETAWFANFSRLRRAKNSVLPFKIS